MVKCCVLLLTSLWIIPNPLSSTEISSYIAIFARDISESGWQMLEDYSYLKLNITVEQKQAAMFQTIRKVCDELKQLEQPIFQIPYDTLTNAITSVMGDSKDNKHFSALFTNMNQIDENFGLLTEYSMKEETADSTTLRDFARAAISNESPSTKMKLKKIHQYIIPEVKYLYRGGLMKVLADNMNNTRESPDQIFLNLFDKIAFIEIKGYAIVQLSYVILETYGEGRYPRERKLTTKKFRHNMDELFEETIQMMTKLSRDDLKEDGNGHLSIAILAQNIIKSGWKRVEDHSDLKLNKTTKQKQARMFQKIAIISEILWKLEQPISSIPFSNVIRSTINNSRDELLFLDFYSHIERIDTSFEQLLEYFEVNDAANMINFANKAISRQATSIKMLMEKIRKVINPETRNGLLKFLADNMEPSDEIIRNTDESPHQFLYRLFNKIALTQMKGYVIIQFSYVILEIYEKGHYLTESQTANENIRKILNELCQETLRMTAKLSRHYWRPDPEYYIKGENYLEISKLLQGYIANKQILTKDNTCYGQCEAFKEITIRKCQKDPFCQKQTRCNGKLYSCRSLATVDMRICLAPIGTARRYDYIEYTDHTLLGVKSTCSTPTFNVEAWTGWCPYCMCYCDDESFYSDRFFSLKQAVSDTQQNKVITGIRFVKKNRIIHLQIQQGEILPYGVINATTLEWVPIENFAIYDRYVYNRQDFLKMTWKDKTVDLHVIEVNDDKSIHKRVLTGVRFTTLKYGMNSNDQRTHLNLEIRMTTLHFESGKLFPTRGAHTWFRNLNTEFSPDNPRTKIPTDDLDIPTRAKSQNTIVSKGNQFVEFTHTDMFKDAGQTTIPFIDSQDVVTKVPTPLIGAGLYYKSTEGYGGFIGLKVVTYDFTQHL